jgi:quercetin dioxygenase-like cupin family protein
MVTIEPHQAHKPVAYKHEGEEFIYVLEGSVGLEIDDERFELLPGDSAYYQSSLPHLLKALKGQARILAVIYSE